jgi:hypothetical protein
MICVDDEMDTRSVRKRNKTRLKGVIKKVALIPLSSTTKPPKEVAEKAKSSAVRVIKDGNRTVIRTLKNDSITSPTKKTNYRSQKLSLNHTKDIYSEIKNTTAIKISNKISEIRRVERHAAITIQRAFRSYLHLKARKHNKTGRLVIRTYKTSINKHTPVIKDRSEECVISTLETTNLLPKKQGLRIVQTKRQNSKTLSEEQANKEKINAIASLNEVRAKTEKINGSLSEKESVIFKTANNTHTLNLSSKFLKGRNKSEIEQPITHTQTGTMKASEPFSNSKTNTLPLTAMKAPKKLNSEEMEATPQFSSCKCSETDIQFGGNEESSVGDIGPIVIKLMRKQELIVWSFSFDDVKEDSKVISTEIMGIALGKWDVVIGRIINFERVEVLGGSSLSPWVNISLLIPSCLEMFRSLAKSAFDYNLPLSLPKVTDSFTSELNESLLEDFVSKGLIKGTTSPNFDLNVIIKALSSLKGESSHNHTKELSSISEYATWNLIRVLESDKGRLEPGQVIEFFSREVVSECLAQIAHSFVLMKEINGKKLKLSKEFDTELTAQRRIKVIRKYMNHKEFVYGNASKVEVDLADNRALNLFGEANKSAVHKIKLIDNSKFIEREAGQESKEEANSDELMNYKDIVESMKKVEEKREPERRHDFFIQEMERMKEGGEMLKRLENYSYSFCRE